MRIVLSLLTAAAVLSACSGYAPPAQLTGATRDEVVARMGPPETQRQVDGGTRLEFPRGPYGRHTWFVYLDAAGRVTRAEQVLDGLFGAITIGDKSFVSLLVRLGKLRFVSQTLL